MQCPEGPEAEALKLFCRSQVTYPLLQHSTPLQLPDLEPSQARLRASPGLFDALNRMPPSIRPWEACSARKWGLHSRRRTYLVRFSAKNDL